MQAELEALELNNTYIITDLSLGKMAIASKWTYKIKYRDDRTMDRFKATLIAKGYNQLASIDYIDSFSPVAKLVTIRVFLSMAAAFTWPIH